MCTVQGRQRNRRATSKIKLQELGSGIGLGTHVDVDSAALEWDCDTAGMCGYLLLSSCSSFHGVPCGAHIIIRPLLNLVRTSWKY